MIDHNYQKYAPFDQVPSSCQTEPPKDKTSQIIGNDKDARLYTGMKKERFLTLIRVMSPFADKKYRMPVSDQILMTLMKLRFNLVGGDLARRFNISSGYVSTIISFWIRTLATVNCDNMSVCMNYCQHFMSLPVDRFLQLLVRIIFSKIIFEYVTI